MRNNFRGWKTVYGFTFRQSVKGVGFKVVTSLVAILIIGIIILINIISAKPDEVNEINEVTISPIDKVYILDNSGLEPIKNFQIEDKQFQHIDFITITDQSREDLIESAKSNSSQSIAVIISPKEFGYEIEAVIPDNSTITKKQAKELLKPMSSILKSNQLKQTGLTPEQLTSVLKPTVTSFTEIGEDTSDITIIINMVAPMIFGLLIYFMLLLHGQTVSKSVSTEKTSKLMETLLTSIHPYALITGKILAITSVAILQLLTWIASIFIGLYAGNTIAHNIYPEYENSVITMINYLRDHIGETALTLPSFILAILILCLGFLFYCVIAGLAGCLVAKPEDVASTQGIFVFPIIISWAICYFSPLMGKKEILNVARYIPFTTPFCVPVNLITGTIGLLEGFISMVILLIFSYLIIILSGRIYKGLSLYTGQKINFKMIKNVLKADKNG